LLPSFNVPKFWNICSQLELYESSLFI
jgi:hypothetical protein